MTDCRVTIETKTVVKLDLELAARWFANISDDDAAKFFSAVAKEAEKWPVENALYRFQTWCQYIGFHMAECQCGEAGKQMICEIADAIRFKETSEVKP